MLAGIYKVDYNFDQDIYKKLMAFFSTITLAFPYVKNAILIVFYTRIFFFSSMGYFGCHFSFSCHLDTVSVCDVVLL